MLLNSLRTIDALIVAPVRLTAADVAVFLNARFQYVFWLYTSSPEIIGLSNPLTCVREFLLKIAMTNP